MFVWGLEAGDDVRSGAMLATPLILCRTSSDSWTNRVNKAYNIHDVFYLFHRKKNICVILQIKKQQQQKSMSLLNMSLIENRWTSIVCVSVCVCVFVYPGKSLSTTTPKTTGGSTDSLFLWVTLNVQPRQALFLQTFSQKILKALWVLRVEKHYIKTVFTFTNLLTPLHSTITY